MRAISLVTACIALFALSASAWAQGVAWEDLSEGQRRLLARHEQRWAELEPQRQEQIARGADRFLDMNRRDVAQEQRRTLRERRPLRR